MWTAPRSAHHGGPATESEHDIFWYNVSDDCPRAAPVRTLGHRSDTDSLLCYFLALLIFLGALMLVATLCGLCPGPGFRC